jgi:hypothetical protein
MRWQGTATTLHHHNNHHNNNNNGTAHDNDAAAGVLDRKQHQPGRAQQLHADTRRTTAARVDAQAPRE